MPPWGENVAERNQDVHDAQIRKDEDVQMRGSERDVGSCARFSKLPKNGKIFISVRNFPSVSVFSPDDSHGWQHFPGPGQTWSPSQGRSAALLNPRSGFAI